MKILDTILGTGKNLLLAGIVASCASSGYVRREYAGTVEQQREAAYNDIKRVLEDVCADYSISSSGFYCAQHSMEQGWIASNYQWPEIQSVECVGKEVNIMGDFDQSAIYVPGLTWQKVSPRCMDLAYGMKVYIGERTK